MKWSHRAVGTCRPSRKVGVKGGVMRWNRGDFAACCMIGEGESQEGLKSEFEGQPSGRDAYTLHLHAHSGSRQAFLLG